MSFESFDGPEKDRKRVGNVPVLQRRARGLGDVLDLGQQALLRRERWAVSTRRQGGDNAAAVWERRMQAEPLNSARPIIINSGRQSWRACRNDNSQRGKKPKKHKQEKNTKTGVRDAATRTTGSGALIVADTHNALGIAARSPAFFFPAPRRRRSATRASPHR